MSIILQKLLIVKPESNYSTMYQVIIVFCFIIMCLFPFLISNGNEYECDWEYDNKTRYGIYTWTNGDKYDGEWIDDKKIRPMT